MLLLQYVENKRNRKEITSTEIQEKHFCVFSILSQFLKWLHLKPQVEVTMTIAASSSTVNNTLLKKKSRK